jgi:hypothetical protein
MIKYVDLVEDAVSFSRSLVFRELEKTADLKKEEKLDKRILDFSTKAKSDAKKVFVLMTAMSASDYWGDNNNHDYFFEKDLWNDDDPNTGYRSFLTANPFRNHKNDDPSKGLGAVEISTYNPKMHRVELVVRVDRDKADKHGHGDLFDKLMAGEHYGVSMGIKIPQDYCSYCGNPAKVKKDYCEHIRNMLGKIMPNGVKVVMLNPKGRLFDISFIDGRQADDIARVHSKIDDIPKYQLTRPNKNIEKVKEEKSIEKTASIKTAEEHGVFYHGSPHKITSLKAGSWVTPHLDDARIFGIPWGSSDLKPEHNNDPSGRPPKELHFNDEILNGDYSIPDYPLHVYKIHGPVKPAATNTGRHYDWNRQTTEELPVELVEEHKSWKQAVKHNLGEEMRKIAEKKIGGHTATMPDGNKIDIEKLYSIVNTREPTNVDITKFKYPMSKQRGFSEKRLKDADTSFPIMFDETGHLVDGRHRVTKLKQEGKTEGLGHLLKKEDLSSVIIKEGESTYDYNGVKIKIEYPVGSTRKGKGWSTKMKASYGRIPKTVGADGECCDVYLAAHPRGDNVYVIRQVDDKGEFDEHKYMMGFITKEEAKRVFLEHIPEKYYSAIAEIKIEKLKEILGIPTKEATMIKEVPTKIIASGYKLEKIKKV